MTLKIVKEKKLGEDPFYSLYADDKFLSGSYDLAKVEKMYHEYKEDPTIFERKETIMEETIQLPKTEQP